MVRKWGYKYLKLVDGFFAVYCQQKVLKYAGPTSFIIRMSYIVRAQRLKELETFGCKWLFTEMLPWLSIMAVWLLDTIDEHPVIVSMSLRWASMECQWFTVLPIQQSEGCIDISFQIGSMCHLYSSQGKRHTPHPILEMIVNGASMMFAFHLG